MKVQTGLWKEGERMKMVKFFFLLFLLLSFNLFSIAQRSENGALKGDSFLMYEQNTVRMGQYLFAEASLPNSVQSQSWFHTLECTPWEHVDTYYDCLDLSSCNDIYGYDCLTKVRFYVYERQCDVYSEPGHYYVKTVTQHKESGAIVDCCNICVMHAPTPAVRVDPGISQDNAKDCSR